VRVAVAATPSVALPTLDWLHTSEHELSLVITRPDRPAGRGRTLRDSVVAQWAQAHEVVVLKPEFSEELVQKLLNVDVVVTIGYGVILPIAVLSTPKFGFLNLHFSLLPSWRGAAPVQRAILHGDTTSGVTVFALDAGMDTGPIYVSQQMVIEPDENAAHLLERMAAIGPSVVSKALELVSQEFAPVPQGAEGVSYAPKITKDEAKIDWGVSATSIDRQVRAFTPEPGAWTIWRGEMLRISRTRTTTSELSLKPGEISTVHGRLLVGCGSNEVIQVMEMTPAGKRDMTAAEWVNGARLSAGERFV